MSEDQTKKRIALLGGGPSALFMYKRLIATGDERLAISIFERKQTLGAGMPYSVAGANEEHITNVSDNEIPILVTSIEDWVKSAPAEILAQFNITPDNFNEYKVLPRLFFGEYLKAQFVLLQEVAKKAGITTEVFLETSIADVIDLPAIGKVKVLTTTDAAFEFDEVVICTGHYWPQQFEGKVKGYFDTPYPPSKLTIKLNHPVAIKGSSLTAIDAIRTLSRENGVFSEDATGKTVYQLHEGSENLRLVMHSRSGLLPAVRFHLDDPHLGKESLLSEEELVKHKDQNDGFISLDYIFENDFKVVLQRKDPSFYEKIKDLDLEGFVAMVMELREHVEPFLLLKAEYQEAEKSIKRRESVYWKELLAILSFAMNYPAKYLSAEDMLRLQRVLMPLISIVIAFVPQSSCKELIALHDAGVLSLVEVGAESRVEALPKGGIIYHYKIGNEEKQVYYQTFVDSVGQPHLSEKEFPFQSLLQQKIVSKARLRFKSHAEAERLLANKVEGIEQHFGQYYLKVPGVAINDHFQLVDDYGSFHERIFLMAVPYMGGFNPDYSGLDFGDAASKKIIEALFN